MIFSTMGFHILVRWYLCIESASRSREVLKLFCDFRVVRSPFYLSGTGNATTNGHVEFESDTIKLTPNLWISRSDDSMLNEVIRRHDWPEILVPSAETSGWFERIAQVCTCKQLSMSTCDHYWDNYIAFLLFFQVNEAHSAYFIWWFPNSTQ